MVVHGTGDCLGTGVIESSLACLGEHQTCNPRVWVQLRSKFWSVVKFLANLSNLTNLLSRNLGKTQLFAAKITIFSRKFSFNFSK